MIEHHVVALCYSFRRQIRGELLLPFNITSFTSPNLCFNDVFSLVVKNDHIHPVAPGWDFHIHCPVYVGNELIKVGKKEMLSDEFLRSFGDLQDPESCAGNKVSEVIHELFHLNLSGVGEVLKSVGIFGEVVALQPVDYRLECLDNAGTGKSG